MLRATLLCSLARPEAGRKVSPKGQAQFTFMPRAQMREAGRGRQRRSDKTHTGRSRLAYYAACC